MAQAKVIKEVGYVDVRNHAHGGLNPVAWHDCAGGGQVVVQRNIAYVGNMRNPYGTMIIDVEDPKNPRLLAELKMPVGTHSHKVRVHGDIMITNREVLGRHARHGETPPARYFGGLSIWDIADPSKPKHITDWNTTDDPSADYATGVHRFDFDGRYAYISPTMAGYVGNIMMILDLKDPARPQEVGRWWMPGQWVGGGETPTWKGDAHKCHHPLRFGNRLYTSYWQGGLVILDIDDMSKPKFVSGLDWSPPFPWPTPHGATHPVQDRGAGFHGRLRRGRLSPGRLSALSGRFPVGTLCDVGGATGLLCIEAAKRHPHLNCISFDLPVVERARQLLLAAAAERREGT